LRHDAARFTAFVDAGSTCGLSVAFDGATRAWLSADLGLPIPTGLCGGTDIRAGALPAFADLRLRLHAHSRTQPNRLLAGRLEFHLRRNDGGRELAQRIIPYHGDVAAADARRRRAREIAPVAALSDRRLRGLRNVSDGRRGPGLRLFRRNRPALRRVSEH